MNCEFARIFSKRGATISLWSLEFEPSVFVLRRSVYQNKNQSSTSRGRLCTSKRDDQFLCTLYPPNVCYMKKILCLAQLFLFSFFSYSVYSQVDHLGTVTNLQPHPRILLFKGEEEAI